MEAPWPYQCPSAEERTEMVRVVPSQIVSVIAQVFPQVGKQASFSLAMGCEAAIMGLLALIDQLSPELLPSRPHVYVQLVLAREALRQAPKVWEAHKHIPVVTTPGFFEMNPV